MTAPSPGSDAVNGNASVGITWLHARPCPRLGRTADGLRRRPGPDSPAAEGAWTEAAQVWDRIGSPYERAECRAAGDDGDRLEALAVPDALGAAPAGDRVRSGLRAAGVAGVPPRPGARTRKAVAGPTAGRLGVDGAGTTNLAVRASGGPGPAQGQHGGRRTPRGRRPPASESGRGTQVLGMTSVWPALMEVVLSSFANRMAVMARPADRPGSSSAAIWASV